MYMDKTLNVCIYDDSADKTKKIVIDCLIKYFSNRPNTNLDVVDINKFRLPSNNCDIAVVWGMAAPETMHKTYSLYRPKVRDHQNQHGKVTVCIELGYVNRDQYFSISFNDIAGFGSYFTIPDNIPIEPRIPIEISKRSFVDNNAPILFCGQIPYDTQIRCANYVNWMEATINSMRQRTNRQIIFRMHPKLVKKKFLDSLKNKLKVLNIPLSNIDNFNEDIMRSHCVVAYNSNSLIDAVLKGVPVFCFGKGSVAINLTNTEYEYLEDPWYPSEDMIKREMAMISWYQWSVSEMESGIPFDFLIDKQNNVNPSVVHRIIKKKIRKPKPRKVKVISAELKQKSEEKKVAKTLKKENKKSITQTASSQHTLTYSVRAQPRPQPQPQPQPRISTSAAISHSIEKKLRKEIKTKALLSRPKQISSQVIRKAQSVAKVKSTQKQLKMQKRIYEQTPIYDMYTPKQYPTDYKIYCMGRKIVYRKYVTDAVQKEKDWSIAQRFELNNKRCFQMLVALAGISNTKDLFLGSIPRTLGLDVNPYGVNSEPLPFRLMVDSYCYSRCRETIIYDETKWHRHQRLFNLPVSPNEWKMKKNKPIILLLPSAGGWKNPDVHQFIKKYRKMLKDLLCSCENIIYLRPHPKTIKTKQWAINKILESVNNPRVVVNRDPIPELCENIQAVVTDWGTCCVQFAMRGIPIFNPLDTKFIASPIAQTSLAMINNIDKLHFSKTPKEFMVYLSQTVFSKQDFDSGDFMRYVNLLASTY
ncbi:hypothetical protein TetV_611 [Tetraselmis virus 1]|uniref:Capsule polysaccharide biosynthesis protein n=1 Tax=Tetraselmis virus 1 TaxID=2060617 RepID=A0A2P0VP54_9VIRU|nr:hypothetical protein QJ968_gp443 [Tetraselmis virus 1]AUF82693.1 hypothetical protein TetV_611 [Tetraselmis virus 1]